MDEMSNSLALFPASAMKVRLFHVLNDCKMKSEKDKKKKDNAKLFHPPMTRTKWKAVMYSLNEFTLFSIHAS